MANVLGPLLAVPPPSLPLLHAAADPAIHRQGRPHLLQPSLGAPPGQQRQRLLPLGRPLQRRRWLRAGRQADQQVLIRFICRSTWGLRPMNSQGLTPFGYNWS